MQKKPRTASALLVAGPLIPLFLFTLVGFSLLNYHLKKENRVQFEKELVRLASVGSRVLPLECLKDDAPKIDAFTDAYTGRGDFRVTIIDSTGKVQGDSRLSRYEIEKLDNHKSRKEIVEALRHGIGVSERYSKTLKTKMMYAAIYFNNRGKSGYFRVSAPVDTIDREFQQQQLAIAVFCFLALVSLTIVSLLLSRYVVSVVQKNREQLEQEVQSTGDKIEVLQNLGTQLTACHIVNEALEITALVTAKLLPRYTGMIGLMRASRDKVEVVAQWNGEVSGNEKFLPEQCWALRTGKQYAGNLQAGKVMCEHYNGKGGISVCIPLLAQGDMIGVMQFVSPDIEKMDSKEQQLAAAVAENVSLSLASLRSRESLHQQAIRDPLTGLYNRRYLMETLGHEFSRSKRHELPMSVLMMDVDHFKQFNDQNGHDAGDHILKEFGRLVKETIRNEDSACRFGGEEFVVLLPETRLEAAIIAAERICQIMRNNTFIHQGISLGMVTISIGVASFPGNSQDSETLLKSADEALYEAKRTGRNRVVASGTFAP